MRRRGCAKEESEEQENGEWLSNWVDPITLGRMRRPAMSPSGHVMGMATWAAVLAESGRCPFTQQLLAKEQVSAHRDTL